MQFINPLYLITYDEEENEIGDYKKKYKKRKVYCDINSIRQNEFYQANAVGYKPEISIVLRTMEYKSEDMAELNSVIYKILRTYDKKDGTIELILTRGVEDECS